MGTRRSFLEQAILGGLFAGSIDWWKKVLPVTPAKNAFPIVIATWNNKGATQAAWDVLSKGGRAVDAVEAGARIPEGDPNDTSVGLGGFPDRDGFVTLDACIMDEFGNAGSVSFLQDIIHAVSVARKVMDLTPHVMLSGDGALQFALEQGFKRENLLTDKARQAWEDWKVKSEYKPVINIERHDTIGIVAMDSNQRLAGACTTSGLAFKMHGRVGDSPVIGAGMYSDNEYGSAAATGLGEMVLRTLGSFLLVEEMKRGAHPTKAAETVVRRIARKYPKQAEENQVGFVALDKHGRYGGFAIQPGFNYTVFQNGENRLIEGESLFPAKH